MTEKSTSITYRDNPWYMLFPAGLFGIVGGFFVALGIQESARGSHHLGSTAALGVGLAGLAVAFALFRQSERRIVTFDRNQGVVNLDRRLLWRLRQERWLFKDIATVDAERWDDSDGPLWRPCLVLKSGLRIPLASWNNDEKAATGMCAKAMAVL
jgi:hypothetical protein